MDGLALVAVGAVAAMIPVSMGLASILYTFYPPMIAQPVLLHRRRPCGRRLLDLGCPDVDQHGVMEAR